MSITALPPSSTIPDDGGTYYVCNPYEWAAAVLQKGDSCWFRVRKAMFSWTGESRRPDALTPWRRGTYLSSYMYDGIIAKVYEDDPDDYIEHSLFLDLGDQIIRLEDKATIDQWDRLT